MNVFESAAAGLLERQDEISRLMVQDEPSEASALGIVEESADAPAQLLAIRDELRSIELDVLDTAKGTTVHYMDVDLPKPRKIQRHSTMPLAYEVAVSYTPQGAPYHRVTKSVTRALPRKDETAHDIEFLDRTPIQEYDPDEEIPDYEEMGGIGYKADEKRAQLREHVMPATKTVDEFGTPINDVLGHTQAHDYEDVGMIEAPYTGNGHAWGFWSATRDALLDIESQLARARTGGEVETSPTGYVEPSIPLSQHSETDPAPEPYLVPAARRKAEPPEVWDEGELHEMRLHRMEFMPRKVWNFEFQVDLAESYIDTALSGLETAVCVGHGPIQHGWASGRVFVSGDSLSVEHQLVPRGFERPGTQTYSVLRVPTGWLAWWWNHLRGEVTPREPKPSLRPWSERRSVWMREVNALQTQLLMLREGYLRHDPVGRAKFRLAAADVESPLWRSVLVEEHPDAVADYSLSLGLLRAKFREELGSLPETSEKCLSGTNRRSLWNRKAAPDYADLNAIALGRQFAYLA